MPGSVNYRDLRSASRRTIAFPIWDTVADRHASSVDQEERMTTSADMTPSHEDNSRTLRLKRSTIDSAQRGWYCRIVILGPVPRTILRSTGRRQGKWSYRTGACEAG